MRLWRITRHPALDGQGGMVASGRWHTAPKPVIYCADHPSTALLEVLVHLEVAFEDIPRDYQLVEIEVPDSLSIDSIFGSHKSTESNIDFAIGQMISRMTGDAILSSMRVAAFSAPSIILSEAKIFILNVAHPSFSQISIVSQRSVEFDPRLWK